MAITIFHKVINNNKIRIINNNNAPQQKYTQVSADIKTTKHTISEIKTYD